MTTLCVQFRLSPLTVWCVAPQVIDTGAPISVPVGDVTKGHVFNVTGDVLNLKEGEHFEVSQRWPIHRQPPAFDELEPRLRCSKPALRLSTY